MKYKVKVIYNRYSKYKPLNIRTLEVNYDIYKEILATIRLGKYSKVS
jgi:hypothetical protein